MLLFDSQTLAGSSGTADEEICFLRKTGAGESLRDFEVSCRSMPRYELRLISHVLQNPLNDRTSTYCNFF